MKRMLLFVGVCLVGLFAYKLTEGEGEIPTVSDEEQSRCSAFGMLNVWVASSISIHGWDVDKYLDLMEDRSKFEADPDSQQLIGMWRDIARERMNDQEVEEFARSKCLEWAGS